MTPVIVERLRSAIRAGEQVAEEQIVEAAAWCRGLTVDEWRERMALPGGRQGVDRGILVGEVIDKNGVPDASQRAAYRLSLLGAAVE